MAQSTGARQPHPSQEAPRQAGAGSCPARDCHKSKIRARIEHVFAQQKAQMGLFIRTIGIKRAAAKIKLAILAFNMNRLIFHERRAAMG